MRTSKPGAGNKFYITRSAGGYSQCIQGYPTDRACNVLSNCVGYACGRFNEIIGSMKYPTLNCNAENFIERARSLGLSVGQTPKLGAIMCWQVGSLAGGDGAGHVAIVEKVIDANTVYTSESSYGSTAFFNTTRSRGNGKWGLNYSNAYFRGFIYNPAVKDTDTATGGSTGSLSGYSDEQLAKMVLAGQFGNGNARKAALGSRYAAVQAIVNQMVAGTYKAASKKSNEAIAQEVIDGKWGNGADRKNRLTAAGYNYAAIQAIVNQKVAASARKSNETIANEVLQGKWGNGEDRRKRLTAAGYNYAAIQAIVNQKVSGGSGKALRVGSRIRIRNGAMQYGKNVGFAAKVYQNVYTVTEIYGNRVVFAAGGTVMGAVAASNCIVQ